METPDLLKYPRTPHLEGSCLGPGDEDLSQVPIGALFGLHVIVEEKVDGANCALCFNELGELFIQSRGHYLVGGPRERHFEQLKGWAATHHRVLLQVLGSRYVLYGEWLAAKHTVFYDVLPHYFLEFDVYDTKAEAFLDTHSRRDLLRRTPVVSVPVLFEGVLIERRRDTIECLTAFLRPSLYKSPEWRQRLEEQAVLSGQDPLHVTAETDSSDIAEGLYVKTEGFGQVTGRYKWVRHDFLATILDPAGATSTHWLDRPHVANILSEGADLYADAPTASMRPNRLGQIL
jgi:hypothetical protein